MVIQTAEVGAPQADMERDPAMELANRIAMMSRFATDFDAQSRGHHRPTDCDGSLISVSAGRFRCQVGHAWTAEALLSDRLSSTARQRSDPGG